ncbi:MAG: tRNA adenosine(34) deaminase TadA [Oscillospiraceae bacterium]|nr:tRNA adenosine(34) deaminase TadA [Oscillospiraceae bacterium]
MNLHEQYMREALKLAWLAGEQGEVPVGAVVVKNGRIIGEGYNLRERDKNALAHAEVVAIHRACEALGGWRLSGCDLYVTLEPCPMCAGAVINSRVRRVFFGARDDRAGSCGSLVNLFELPYNHHPEYEGGVLAEECGALLKEFFGRLR